VQIQSPDTKTQIKSADGIPQNKTKAIKPTINRTRTHKPIKLTLKKPNPSSSKITLNYINDKAVQHEWQKLNQPTPRPTWIELTESKEITDLISDDDDVIQSNNITFTNALDAYNT